MLDKLTVLALAPVALALDLVLTVWDALAAVDTLAAHDAVAAVNVMDAVGPWAHHGPDL